MSCFFRTFSRKLLGRVCTEIICHGTRPLILRPTTLRRTSFEKCVFPFHIDWPCVRFPKPVAVRSVKPLLLLLFLFTKTTLKRSVVCFATLTRMFVCYARKLGSLFFVRNCVAHISIYWQLSIKHRSFFFFFNCRLSLLQNTGNTVICCLKITR